MVSGGRNLLRNFKREGIFKPYAESVFVPKLGGRRSLIPFTVS